MNISRITGIVFFIVFYVPPAVNAQEFTAGGTKNTIKNTIPVIRLIYNIIGFRKYLF